jgi:small basic protein
LLVFVASILNYGLMLSSYENAFLPWAILMPLGGIMTGWYAWRHERNQKAHTYVEEVMKYVLIAFLVSLFTVLFFMSKLGLATYPLVMLVYGMWLFVSGGAIRFRPLIAGGVINWVIGIGAFFATFPVQLLLLATAVLLGYIIPGHMLKSRFRKQQAVMPVM